MSKFYVYLHRRASDGRVFYVGKGKDKRAWVVCSRNRHWGNVAAKHGYIVEIYRDEMAEIDAHALEIELIAQYGRANLCNLTDGGEGASGLKRVFSESHRAAISAKAMGRKASDETKSKISKAGKGRVISEEQREKLRVSSTGRKLSTESRLKLSASLKGRTISQYQRDMNTEKLGKRVKCDNGLEFKSIGQAALWLKSLGFLKASSQSISRACATNKTAYGFSWIYCEKENGGC